MALYLPLAQASRTSGRRLLPTDMNACLVVTGQLPCVAGAPGWRSQSMSARKGFTSS